MDPKLAVCARLLWARVLEEPLSLTEVCQERGRWLAGLGYKPILQKTEQRTPFFLLEAGKRLPVSFERGLFRTPHADHTLIELLRRLDERPGDFSAAVHLRPHLQDFLLPTAAYVAGPTELAYFLQLLPGYRALGIPAPTIVLRASLTLVEPAVARTLERLGVDPAELSGGTDGALTALVRREQRFAAPALWERTRAAALKPVADLAADLAAEHPDLAQRAEQARGKVDFLLRDLESRSLAELRKKSDTARDQLERARARLFPNGGLQERTLSACYFLGKYGPGLVEQLLESLPRDTALHHFGTIVPEERRTRPRASGRRYRAMLRSRTPDLLRAPCPAENPAPQRGCRLRRARARPAPRRRRAGHRRDAAPPAPGPACAWSPSS